MIMTSSSNALKEYCENLSAQQRIQHRKPFLLFFFSLIGKEVEIELIDGRRYQGLFYTASSNSPDDFKIVLRATKQKGAKSHQSTFVQGSTAIFNFAEARELKVVKGNHSLSQFTAEIRIDADINQTGRNLSHLQGRELVPATDWLQENTFTAFDEVSSSSGTQPGNGQWDQFEVNKRLFQVTSSFNENLYTSKLDMKALSQEQIQFANKVAAEIESQDSSNIHLREERGQLISGDCVLSEEDLYSGVLTNSVLGNSNIAAAPTTQGARTVDINSSGQVLVAANSIRGKSKTDSSVTSTPIKSNRRTVDKTDSTTPKSKGSQNSGQTPVKQASPSKSDISGVVESQQSVIVTEAKQIESHLSQETLIQTTSVETLPPQQASSPVVGNDLASPARKQQNLNPKARPFVFPSSPVIADVTAPSSAHSPKQLQSTVGTPVTSETQSPILVGENSSNQDIGEPMDAESTVEGVSDTASDQPTPSIQPMHISTGPQGYVYPVGFLPPSGAFAEYIPPHPDFMQVATGAFPPGYPYPPTYLVNGAMSMPVPPGRREVYAMPPWVAGTWPLVDPSQPVMHESRYQPGENITENFNRNGGKDNLETEVIAEDIAYQSETDIQPATRESGVNDEKVEAYSELQRTADHQHKDSPEGTHLHSEVMPEQNSPFVAPLQYMPTPMPMPGYFPGMPMAYPGPPPEMIYYHYQQGGNSNLAVHPSIMVAPDPYQSYRAAYFQPTEYYGDNMNAHQSQPHGQWQRGPGQTQGIQRNQNYKRSQSGRSGGRSGRANVARGRGSINE